MTPRTPRARTREDGAAVPVVLGLTGVLVAIALAGAAGGQVLVAQRRASAVADLAALAGAVAVQQGQEPCAAVRRMAALGPGSIASCEVEGEQVRVVAHVDLRLAGRALTVRARGHAGPRSAA